MKQEFKTIEKQKSEIDKIINENKEMKTDVEILKKKLDTQTADFDKCKIEYQNLLNIQLNKVRSLEATILEKNKHWPTTGKT